jgi:hypothetical protein
VRSLLTDFLATVLLENLQEILDLDRLQEIISLCA